MNLLRRLVAARRRAHCRRHGHQWADIGLYVVRCARCRIFRRLC